MLRKADEPPYLGPDVVVVVDVLIQLSFLHFGDEALHRVEIQRVS